MACQDREDVKIPPYVGPMAGAIEVVNAYPHHRSSFFQRGKVQNNMKHQWQSNPSASPWKSRPNNKILKDGE